MPTGLADGLEVGVLYRSPPPRGLRHNGHAPGSLSMASCGSPVSLLREFGYFDYRAEPRGGQRWRPYLRLFILSLPCGHPTQCPAGRPAAVAPSPVSSQLGHPADIGATRTIHADQMRREAARKPRPMMPEQREQTNHRKQTRRSGLVERQILRHDGVCDGARRRGGKHVSSRPVSETPYAPDS